MQYLARAAALTWGRRCDGFVAFSNQTVVDLNMLDLQHDGPESYHNMWQKTRRVWTYLQQHYGNEYDMFHLGGDDMYVIPENLKLRYTEILLLQSNKVGSSHHSSANTSSTADSVNVDIPPIYMGQWAPHGPNDMFVSGGGGYTLNRPALRALVEQALPDCHVHTTASHEDRLVTKCLRSVGISPSDTRDPMTAEQTYHDTNPQNLYLTQAVPPDSPRRRRASFHAKLAAYWEGLPHPSLPNTTVGPRPGLQSAAVHSVSFHKIHYPDYMVRLHVLLLGDLCPASSVLGRALSPSSPTP